MPETAEPWSLTSLREKLIKIGAKAIVSLNAITHLERGDVDPCLSTITTIEKAP